MSSPLQEQLCSYHEVQWQPDRESYLQKCSKKLDSKGLTVTELLTISLALAVFLFTKT